MARGCVCSAMRARGQAEPGKHCLALPYGVMAEILTWLLFIPALLTLILFAPANLFEKTRRRLLQ
jgi:hypothetical protein